MIMQKAIKILSIILLLLFTSFSLLAEMDSFNYAEKLYNDEFYDLAVEEYKNFIDNNPQDERADKAYYKLLHSYLKLENYKKIIYNSTKFLQQYNESGYRGDVLYFLAKSYYEEGLLDKSEKMLKRIKKYNKDSNFYVDSIYLLTKINKNNDNLQNYEQNLKYLLNLSPGKDFLKKIYKELVYLYYKKNKYNESISYLNQLKEEDLENGEWLWLKSDIYFQMSDYNKSLNNLNTLINRYSDTKYYLYALKRRGDIYFIRKNYNLALKNYQIILDKNPNNKYADDALKSMIDIHDQLNNNNKAVENMKYFIKAYPNSKHMDYILNLIIKHYKDIDDVENTIKYYNNYLEYIDSEEKYITILLDKVEFLNSNNLYKKSINSLIDFVQSHGKSKLVPYITYEIGLLYGEKLKDYDRAITTLTQILNDKDYGDKAYYKIGIYYEKQDRIQKAISTYKKLLSKYNFSSFTSKAKNRIKYLEKYILTDTSDAIKKFNNLINEIKEHKEINIDKKRADIFFYLKDFEQAFKYYSNADVKNKNYFKSYIYKNLKSNSSKSAIHEFINKNIGTGESTLNELYKDVLIFYKITNNIEPADFKFYFDTFKTSDNEVILSYIDYLISNNYYGEILKFNPPKEISQSNKTYLSALKFYYNENYGEAKSKFKKLLNENFSNSENVYFYLAKISYITQNLDQSKEYVVKIKNDLDLKIKASILLSKIYYQKNMYEDAVFNIYNVLQRKNKYYSDYEVMSIYLDALKKTNQSNLIRITLNKMGNDNEKLKALKGVNYIEIGNTQKGEALLKNISGTEGKTKLYEYYKKNKMWDEIIEYFNKNEPYDVSRLIISYLKKENIKRASGLYNTYSRNLNQYEAEILYYFGEYYYKSQKDFDKAQNYFKKIISKYDNTSWVDEALYMMGNIYNSKNELDKAESTYQRILNEYPTTNVVSKIQLSLGEIYYKKGNFKKSIEYFKNSYSNSSDLNTYYNIGLTYKKLNQFDKAERIFKNISEKDLNSELYYNAYINYAYVLIDQNKLDKAIETLETLLDIAPLKYNLEIQFHIGDCYFKKRKYKKAIREYLKVKYYYNQENKSNFQWLITSLFKAGKTYEIMNEFEKAINLYEHITDITGKNTTYYKTAVNRIQQLSNY
ncbi:MAG: tetratricopeptide repeat protein [Candidatus Mcinerneyibacterium aminivorans]|uniref:Tetratricopeptide repeat protein n=1 Tax=Candidatus Mcinerneyibacterium aminivorans TaxID=2703815 RepID=A0A5D0ME32_9BACT|nr:MAG: tetratricopeptide repeat protein [Candidatus Mcinerneyibacterium aminivorans]